MTVQTVFERSEKKFLLPKKQLTPLLQALRPSLLPDEYGLHTICTLYYDTPDFLCGQRQLEKPFFREKLRLRSYGVPQNGSTVYLELKKKLDGITYKRRTPLTLGEAKAYMQCGQPPRRQDQVFGEIDWALRQRKLQPKAVICYDRIALTGEKDAGLRVTFDQNARFRESQLDLAKGDWGSLLATPGTVLMEIKTPGALPVWLCHILSAQGLYTQSFSKYGNTYQSMLQQEVCRHAG